MAVSIGDPSLVGAPASADQPTGPTTSFESESQAHEAVKAAQKEVAEAVEEEREAVRVAAEIGGQAATAEALVQEKVAQLQELGESLAPEERAALEEELAAAGQEAAALRKAAGEADALVEQWRQYRDTVEKNLEEVTQSANLLLRSLGQPEAYTFSARIKDAYAQRGTAFLDQLAKLLGTSQSLPSQKNATLDARRIGVATEANPANGAQLLVELLLENEEAAYRQSLASDAQPEATRMGAGLSELLEGLPEGEEELGRQVAHAILLSLSRAVELLSAAVAWPLVESFAQGISDEDPRGQLEEWLREVLTEGPVDLTFAVELAVALHRSGKDAAADEVVTAIHRTLAEARERFVQLAKEADALDAKLARHLPGFARGMRPEELERELQAFKAEHLDPYEARERGASALGAVLNGAALAVAFSQAGGLPANEHTGQLLEQAVLAMGLSERLLGMDAGQRLLALSLDLQAGDGRTFLDVLPDATRLLAAFRAQDPGALARAGLEPERFGADGTAFLAGIQQGFAQLLVPHLLVLRSGNHPEVAFALLRSAVTRNAGLFGLDVREAAGVCELFTSLARDGKSLDLRRIDLRKALMALERLGSTASAPGSGTGVATLKALGVVLVLSTVLTSMPSQLRVITELLCGAMPRLGLGEQGLGVLCCFFAQLHPTPSVNRLSLKPWTVGAQMSGSQLTRLMDAFAAVVGAGRTEQPLPPDFCSMLSVASRPLLVEALVTSFLRGPTGGTPGNVRSLFRVA